jgi:hypothetical protein
MKKNKLKKKIEHFACNKSTIDQRMLQMKKSFDEVYKIINGGNNKCK